MSFILSLDNCHVQQINFTEISIRPTKSTFYCLTNALFDLDINPYTYGHFGKLSNFSTHSHNIMWERDVRYGMRMRYNIWEQEARCGNDLLIRCGNEIQGT